MVSPPAFREYFGDARTSEAMRGLRMRVMPYNPALRRAVRRCAILLATNRETITVLKEAGAPNVQPYFDNGLPAGSIPDPMPVREERKELTLLWAGRLEPRKALGLGLEALACVESTIPVQLLVAGEGPLRREWEELVRGLGLTERVQFLGAVPFSRMQELFYRADALLFTSLRDSFGSVALEAMAQALPVLTLDHQGVGELVPHEAGIKIPVTTPNETIAALADGIRQMAEMPEARRRMGENGWHFARKNTWPYRAEQMSQWYEECINNHANGQKHRDL
jgi:glycosyltransferase involved in cell wall biosynthesis